MSKRFIFIDISGSMPSEEVDAILGDIRVGDTVVSFDTHLSNIKYMSTKADIASYRLHGAGGTLWEPVRDYIIEQAQRHGNIEARVYSDCYFAGKVPEPIAGVDLTLVMPKSVQGTTIPAMFIERGIKVENLR